MTRLGQIMAAGLAVVASVVCAPGASAMEAATPQAVAANAEFLAYAPPPAAPVKVCVVDTGVDLTTDAAPAVIERHSVYGGTGDDVGGSGLAKHGTLVAGVIASQLDGRDSVGIWPHARIVSVRVFEGSGGGTTTFSLLAALDLCRERGAKVANLSLSGLDHATAEELAWLEDYIVQLRHSRGMNVVAGVGNNAGAVGYPARFPSVLAVGAGDANGGPCSYSNRGQGLDVFAPTCAFEISWPGGGTGSGTGTSYATPMVSALLAALRSYKPELSASTAESLLTGSARLDAASVFGAAGLGWLVRPAPLGRAVVPSDSRTVAPRPDRLRALGVRPPRIRNAAYRRGRLSVRVAGVPDFGRAVLRADGRKYIRATGVFSLRLRRAPRQVSVSIDVPGIGRTPSTTVRVKKVSRPRS
jgi:hypothetical protein